MTMMMMMELCAKTGLVELSLSVYQQSIRLEFYNCQRKVGTGFSDTLLE